MALVDFISKSLSLGTLLLQAILIIFVLHYLYKRIFGRNIKSLAYVEELVKKNSLTLAFLISLTATLSSLFYSEIAKFTPCELCWWQRGAMYPQVLFLGASLALKNPRVKKILINTALLFSFIGLAIALYQSFLPTAPATLQGSGICSPTEISCSIEYVKDFGYVTIPIMSLTAFLMLVFLLLSARRVTPQARIWHPIRAKSI